MAQCLGYRLLYKVSKDSTIAWLRIYFRNGWFWSEELNQPRGEEIWVKQGRQQT
jgi:hypothetical protein